MGDGIAVEAGVDEGRARSERGAAVVEFALVVVPLLLLVVGALAFGLTLGLQQSVTHAASAAAREAIVVPGAAPADVQARVDEVVAQQLGWSSAAGHTSPATVVADRVEVRVTATNPFAAIRIFGVGPPAELHASASLLLEDP